MEALDLIASYVTLHNHLISGKRVQISLCRSIGISWTRATCAITLLWGYRKVYGFTLKDIIIRSILFPYPVYIYGFGEQKAHLPCICYMYQQIGHQISAFYSSADSANCPEMDHWGNNWKGLAILLWCPRHCLMAMVLWPLYEESPLRMCIF